MSSKQVDGGISNLANFRSSTLLTGDVMKALKEEIVATLLQQIKGGKAKLEEDVIVGGEVFKRVTILKNSFEEVVRSWGLRFSRSQIRKIGVICPPIKLASGQLLFVHREFKKRKYTR